MLPVLKAPIKNEKPFSIVVSSLLKVTAGAFCIPANFKNLLSKANILETKTELLFLFSSQITLRDSKRKTVHAKYLPRRKLPINRRD